MNRDDIIRWATQAKLPYYYRTGEISNLPELERFAALVAAAEREACFQIALTIGDDAAGCRHTDEVARRIRARSEA